MKDKMTGRVDISWRIFEKMQKKLKLKSQYQKNHFWSISLKPVKNCDFLDTVTDIFTFLHSSKMFQSISTLKGHLSFDDIFCSSIYFYLYV